jgi:hypothetical protein
MNREIESRKLVLALREFYQQLRKSIPQALLQEMEGRCPTESVTDNLAILDWLRHLVRAYGERLDLQLAASRERQDQYEPLVRRLEDEVRKRIRTEQELRLLGQELQARLEDSRKSAQTILQENATLRARLSAFEKENVQGQAYHSNTESRPVSSHSRKSVQDPPPKRSRQEVKTILEGKLQGRGSMASNLARPIGIVSHRSSCERLLPKAKCL